MEKLICEERFFVMDQHLINYVETLQKEDPALYNKILLGPTVYKNIQNAVECLRMGGIVLFFSSATYGVAANAWDKNAVEKIYRIKDRDQTKPLTIMTNKSKYKEVANLGSEVKPLIDRLITAFWPGYLGVVCAKNKDVIADYVNAGFETINMTCMDISSELLVDAADFPISITSANYSGYEPARNAYMAIEYFAKEDLIDLFLLGPASQAGMNTTMVKVTDLHSFEILRQGPVSEADIKKAAGLFDKNL